jgi:riboflavin biosynthesis pyrimidine reductase
MTLCDNMSLLFERHGVTSLMVEGGRTLIDSFITAGLYDRIRVEKDC